MTIKSVTIRQVSPRESWVKTQIQNVKTRQNSAMSIGDWVDDQRVIDQLQITLDQLTH